jgi:AhpD family alkylhydroperoxidase
MSEKNVSCERPDQLKGKPGECSPEQIEICHGKERVHSCVTDGDGKILEKLKREMGYLPGPAVVMSKRPGLLGDFLAYSKRLQEGGPLSERERNLIALATAAAIGSEHCIRSYAGKAQKAGATEEEVVQAILIAGIVSHARPLHDAYDAAGIFDSDK